MRSDKNPATPAGTCRRRGRQLTKKSRRCVSNSNESAQRRLLRGSPSNLSNVREETEEMEEVAANACESPFDDQLVFSESTEPPGFPLISANNSDDAVLSKSDSIMLDDKTRKIVLIEGNKAIVVLAHPWPKRPPRVPITEEYKKPNPRLSAAELRRQARLVRERKEIVEELEQEKRRRRFLKGVYCLPKKLLFDSRHRLLKWYKLPTDSLPEDSKAS